MSRPTAFLGRLIGLYCVFISLAMLTHKKATVQTVTGLVHDAPLLFIVSVILVLAGLAMILSHNVWSGGALALVVTLVGWIMLIKGLLFLFLSAEGISAVFIAGLRYERLFYLYAAISLALGIYLVFMTRQQRSP